MLDNNERVWLMQGDCLERMPVQWTKRGVPSWVKVDTFGEIK